MPFCIHCGGQEPEGTAFCSSCGRSMAASLTSQELVNKIEEEASNGLTQSKTESYNRDHRSSRSYQRWRWSYKSLVRPGRKMLAIKLMLVVMIIIGATVGALKVIPTFFHHTCDPTTLSVKATTPAPITQVGMVKLFPVISQGRLEGIISGPDCNLWFVADGSGTDWNNTIGRITTDGTITKFPLSHSSNYIGSVINIISGPDGDLWFAEINGLTGGNEQIGRITPAGTITEFPIPNSNSIGSIVSGPDGNLWFTENGVGGGQIGDNGQIIGGNGQIGRITPTGTITEFPLPPNSNSIGSIISGPDGNLWFTKGNREIGRITPSGTITEFLLPAASYPYGITSGPDGNFWFIESNRGIGRITPSGTITEFPIPSVLSYGGGEIDGPDAIMSEPDGNLWFTEHSGDKIGRITSTGAVSEFSLPISSYPPEIIPGSDGNLWFTEANGNIGRITPAGTVIEFPIPDAPDAIPGSLTLGSDGNLWFTENRTGSIGRIIP